MSQFLEESSIGELDLDILKTKKENTDEEEEESKDDMIFAPSDEKNKDDINRNKNNQHNDLKSSQIMDFRFEE
jgi:hypothetical protein